MRKVKRWRYFCNFCKKSGGSSFHMQKHEKECTLNPDRECGMCRIADLDSEPLPKLIAIIKKHVKTTEAIVEFGEWMDYIIDSQDALLDELNNATDYCPACILAAIRQADVPVPVISQFDYSEACKEFWSAYNDTKDDYGYC